MGYWTLDDIRWDRFDRSKVDPELLKVIKAASLVERNARDYAAYLCSVFSDDPEVLRTTEEWAAEEVQHGMALGRWAQLASTSSPRSSCRSTPPNRCAARVPASGSRAASSKPAHRRCTRRWRRRRRSRC
jgi:hypothetical protein